MHRLKWLIQTDDSEAVAKMLDSGKLKMNDTVDEDWTHNLIIIGAQVSLLDYAIKWRSIQVSRALLKKGACVGCALRKACQFGFLALVEELIESKADVSTGMSDHHLNDTSPLIAAFKHPYNPDVIAILLLVGGADVPADNHHFGDSRINQDAYERSMKWLCS